MIANSSPTMPASSEIKIPLQDHHGHSTLTNGGARLALREGLVWLFIILLSGAVLWGIRPPAPLPVTAPASEFSAERALQHVRWIARTPHPIGTSANDNVRDYLVQQLARLNINPQVFPRLGVYSRGGTVVAGQTQDILARVPGTASRRAIMLVAHYDSVYRSPGAADDAAGVASILETVRAIEAGRPLKNDIVVLFTDGEEVGLLGAEALASSPNPWLNDVGLILNFEARGNRGPSLLFETSPRNRRLMQQVTRAAPEAVASSLFYSVYKALPNDTDFSEFRASGIPGLNFAFGENLEAYHSPLDTTANLSPASLQHHGSSSLTLVRHFGEIDLSELQHAPGDAVFFNWFGKRLLSYPESLTVPAEVALTMLVLFAAVVTCRQAGLRFKNLLVTSFWWAAFILILPITLGAISWGLSRVFADRLSFPASGPGYFLLAGIILTGCAGGAVLLPLIRSRSTVEAMYASSLVWICLLTWLVTIALPAANYVLLWPLLLDAGIFVITQAWYRRRGKLPLVPVSFAGTVAMIVLATPLIFLLYVFLTLQVLVALCAGLILSVVIMLAFPLMMDRVGTRSWWPAAVLLVCGLVCLGSGLKMSHPSDSHPAHDTVVYSMNPDHQTALWISFDSKLDSWTTQFFKAGSLRQNASDYLGGDSKSVLASSAPLLPLQGPAVRIVSDERDGSRHKLHMKISSGRSAPVLRLAFAEGVKGIAATVAGRDVPIRQESGRLTFTFYAMGAQEIDLNLIINGAPAISFWVMDQSYGLPPGPSQRPSGLIAWYGSDLTIVCRKYVL